MAKVSPDVMAEANKQLQQAKDFKPKLRQIYDSEPKVPVYLSPMYRPYFGKNMRVMINGISIYMPVDGSIHQVPQTFADEIARRRMCVDYSLIKQGRMSDIQGNYERAPGELSLF